MQRRILIITCAIIALLGFSCSLPNTIEIRIKPDLSLPVNADSGDLSETLLETIEEALAGDGGDMRVLQWMGQGVQTFLIQYDVLKDLELDFLDSLDGTLDFDLELELDDLNYSISLTELNDIGDGLDPITVRLDISDITGELKDSIKDILEDNNDRKFPIVVADTSSFLPPGVEELLNSILGGIEFEDFSTNEFTNVYFGDGEFSITFAISDSVFDYSIVNGGSIAGASIEIREFGLKDKDGFPFITNEDSIFLTGDSVDTAKQTINFSLAGVVIPNEFSVYVEGVYNHSTGLPRVIDLSAKVDVDDNFKIRGVEGFSIEPTTVFLNNIDPISFDFGDFGFIHAQIAEGYIGFGFTPPSTESTPGETWIDGINFDYNILILQEPSPASYGSIEPWSGLSQRQGNIGIDTQAWVYEDSPGNLDGRHINTSDLKLMNSSCVEMSSVANGVTFMLSDQDMNDGLITLEIIPTINITEFAEVNVAIGDFGDIPTIDPIPLDDVVGLIESVTLKNPTVKITFGDVDLNNLSMMISIPALGINPSKTDYKPIVGNNYIEFKPPTEFVTLNIDDHPSGLLVDFDLRLGGTSVNDLEILTITNLNIGQDNFKFEVASIEFIIEDWEATVNLAELDEPIEGTFPKIGDDPLDLSELRDILDGFTFADLKAYLYMSGPQSFFNLNPDLTMRATYTGVPVEGVDLLEDPDRIGPFVLLNSDNPLSEILIPQEGNKYTGSLPANGMSINFGKVLDDLPSDLRITYSAGDNITITKDMLESINDETGELNASILMVVPLSLTAGPGGAKIKIPDMEMDDLLDRTSREDFDILDDLKVTTLNVSIELTSNIFNGGTLYIRREGEAEGSEMLQFPLTGSSLILPITGSMLDTINNTFPYKVVEMGMRFPQGKVLSIPDSLGAVRVNFNADFQYTIRF